MKKSKLIDILFGLITIILLFCFINYLPNTKSSLKYLGCFNLIFSIICTLKYWKKGNISLLIGILLLINISYSSCVCLFAEENARSWQFQLIDLPYNIINVKNYTLFITILMLTLLLKKDKVVKYNLQKISNNTFIRVACYAFLIVSLLYGLDFGTAGIYKPNTNPLYEYAIIIYIFCWIYSGNSKKTKMVLCIYAILYCIQGILIGDRSSCFPMILAFLMLTTPKKINMKNVLIIGVCGVVFANVIDIFRNGNSIFSVNTLNEILNRGFNVNTISFSSYAGTQIIRYGLINNNPFSHFLDYCLCIIVGKTSRFDLATLAVTNGFINKGGGMMASYYYFWGGYLGTIFAALVIGKIINTIYQKDTQLSNILKITITIYAIRWFVYYPIAFFRTAIFVPIVCYFCFNTFNRVLRREKNIFKGE